MKYKRAFLNCMKRGTAEIKMCDYNYTKHYTIHILLQNRKESMNLA